MELTAELQSLKQEFQDFQASYTDLLQLYNETCEELELARKWMESIDYNIIIEGLIYACNTRHVAQDTPFRDYCFTSYNRNNKNDITHYGHRACFYTPTDKESGGVVTNTPASYFKHIASRLRGLDCVIFRPYKPTHLSRFDFYSEPVPHQPHPYPVIQTPQGTMKPLDYCSLYRWDLW